VRVHQGSVEIEPFEPEVWWNPFTHSISAPQRCVARCRCAMPSKRCV